MRTTDPDFRPPFCPNPDCRHHLAPAGWRFIRHGTFQRRAEPRRIRRFRCLACRRCFSTQTFDTTYWLKRPDVQRPLHDALVSCSALRQAGRSLRVAGSTLARQASRLGRHCLLYQRLHGPVGSPAECVVLDGFRTFEYSQFWPFDINVVVGADSHFTYAFTDSELRRSGRMTDWQRRRRAHLEARHGRPKGTATRRAVEQVVALVFPQPASLTLLSDEHVDYPRAFRRLPHAIEHRTVSSRRCRTRRNPLFPVDLLDLLLRHSSSNHKRETIAFSKRRQAALERMAVFQVWRNFQKRVCERRRDSPTPAQRLGLTDHRVEADELFRRRLFPSRVELPEPLRTYYFAEVVTRQIPNGRRHRLRYAA